MLQQTWLPPAKMFLGDLSENTPKFQFKKPDSLFNGIIAEILE
jgi:hypothetical protein